mgnify:CR=1 FL=1
MQVCSHVWYRHKMASRDYKKLFGYDVKRGKVPLWYRQKKSDINKDTWEDIKDNFEKGKVYWFKHGDKKAGGRAL